jgi:plastocyanin
MGRTKIAWEFIPRWPAASLLQENILMPFRPDHRLLILLIAAALLLPAEAFAGGTVEGKVVFNGRPKRNPLIQMGADPNCLSINAGKKVVQELVSLNADKTVDNVFVHITGEVAGGSAPTEPVLIEQEGCIYHPRIAGAMAGQKLTVRNNDSTLHNIHSLSDGANNFNVGQPKAGMESNFELRQPEVMLRIKCDVHPWMVGFLGIKSHPYFAVTADGGSFRIDDVPAGTYTLQAWQEKLGTVDRSIEVKDGETVTVEFAYGGEESASMQPSMPVEDLVISLTGKAPAISD